MKLPLRGGGALVCALVGLGTSMLAGCASDEAPPPAKPDYWEESKPPYLERCEPPDMRPAFGDRNAALAALEQSEGWFKKPSSKRYFPYLQTNDGAQVTHERQVATLKAMRRIIEISTSADEYHAWCAQTFDWYRSVGAGRTGRVLYTAYCEPIFEGRLQPEGNFVWPLYKLPPDLVKDEDGNCLGRKMPDGQLVAYYTRGEIESQNVLSGHELVYLKDPFEVYIAQVQGSARINLPGGKQMCVGYAGKNEYEYTSVGQALVAEKKIPKEKLNLTTLKQYFKDHPGEVPEWLAKNKSYVFFLEREPGPFGCLGTKVTPYHSVATDKDVFPRGGPCVVVTKLPVSATNAPDGVEMRPSTALVFDQDRGGAIKAAGRADVFIGTGPEAERLAGHTLEEGRLYYCFVKDGAVVP